VPDLRPWRFLQALVHFLPGRCMRTQERTLRGRGNCLPFWACCRACPLYAYMLRLRCGPQRMQDNTFTTRIGSGRYASTWWDVHFGWSFFVAEQRVMSASSRFIMVRRAQALYFF
jgi:hypothetical protein